MSIIGWELNFSEVEKRFSVIKKEKFKMETRFDPKTGEPLPKKVKVITEEGGEFFVCKGETYDYIVDLLEDLLVKEKIDTFYDCPIIVLGVELVDGTKFEDIAKLQAKIDQAKTRLIELGILPNNFKKPARFYSYSYSY